MAFPQVIQSPSSGDAAQPIERENEWALDAADDGRRPLSEIVEPARQFLRKLWWFTTAALLLVAVVSRFDLVTLDDLGPLGEGREVAAGDDGAAGLVADEFDALPAVRYAGVDVALLDSRIIPENSSGKPIIVADLAVRNTNATQVRLLTQQINLILGDGTVSPMDRFEFAPHPDRLVLAPGEAQQALAVFPISDELTDDLGSYSLQVGELGRWPENLGLDGVVAPSLYHRSLEVLAQPEDLLPFGNLIVDMTSATAALEYGVYRAPVGDHLAVISLSVFGTPGTDEMDSFDEELWTLVDADGPQRALRATVVERSVAGGNATVELVFAYSTETSELELFVSEDSLSDAVSVARFDVQAFE